MYLWFENHSIFSLKPNKVAGLSQFNKRVSTIQGKQGKTELNENQSLIGGVSTTGRQQQQDGISLGSVAAGNGQTGVSSSANKDQLRGRTT